MPTLLKRPVFTKNKMEDSVQGERETRLAALNFARGSVRLEGFVLSREAEAIHQRYVNGEISAQERLHAIISRHKK